MTVLTNSAGPLYSGWQEVEMTDQQFEVWKQDCCISEIESNRHLFSEEEYERLTKDQ